MNYAFVFDYASFPEQLFSREVTAKEDGQSSARTNDKNQQVKLKKVIQNAY